MGSRVGERLAVEVGVADHVRVAGDRVGLAVGSDTEEGVALGRVGTVQVGVAVFTGVAVRVAAAVLVAVAVATLVAVGAGSSPMRMTTCFNGPTFPFRSRS